MKYLRYLLWLILGLAGAFLLFLLYATIDNYNPPPETLVVENENPMVVNDSSFSAVIWNLGYAGLDSAMDFFYDGGERVRPEKSEVRNNVKNILLTLENYSDFDFVMLQEVDKKSKRSYKTDLYGMIEQLFSDYQSAFGKNYDVAFVPLPPTKPMGSVLSGLQTLSRIPPATAVRHSFEGNYGWPMGVFMLDRCFLVNRYPLPAGNELLVINTHNSAYDDGTLKLMQMKQLKSYLLEEYKKGNHVIVGGDWNQCPPGFKPEYSDNLFDTISLNFIEKGYPATDWTWAYDAGTPTNRRVMIPYTKGTTPTTVIDFFLLSPNIELIEVKGQNLEFANSDHQPVEIKFRIK